MRQSTSSSHLRVFTVFLFFLVFLKNGGNCGARCIVDVLVQAVTSPVIHAEGPHWDVSRQRLFFVDISNQTVNMYNPHDATVNTVYIEGGPVSPVIPTNQPDTYVVGRGIDLVSFTWDGEANRGPLKVLATVDKDKPKNRFNDGKADASGRLWIGTMGPEDPDLKLNQGSLFSFSRKQNFSPIKHLSPVSVSNGLAWNKNDTIMYYVDSPTRNVEAFDFDLQTGKLKNRRVVFSLEKNDIQGVPDGMTIDEDDCLWIAVYNGGMVLHVDPTNSTLMRTISIPATRVTSCVFGGPTMSTLYVTTSRRGLSTEELNFQPLAGSVFAVHNIGIKGQRKSTIFKI